MRGGGTTGMGTQRSVIPPSDGTGTVLLHRGILPTVRWRQRCRGRHSKGMEAMPKGKPPDRVGRPQRQYTPASDGKGHSRRRASSRHGHTGYVTTLPPATADVGTGEMVMADAETGQMDLLPTRLHIGNGENTSPHLQLRHEDVEPPQIRPSSHNSNN